MWSEICDLVPLITGLDSCIEHDIAELESCIEHNKAIGDEDCVKLLEKELNELREQKVLLDNMNPIKRWFHCQSQFRKEQKRIQKAIDENNKYKRRLGIWC